MPRSGRIDIPTGDFGITRNSIRMIEDYIEDNKFSIDKLRYGMDTLVRVLVNITRTEALARSGGPVAARHRSNPALAFKIPVQRITGQYYAGWHLRRVRNAHWMLYNDSVEAYLIETGMFLRVRRPILKLSFISMLRFIQVTKTAETFADWVLAPRRNSRGQFQSFNRRITPFLAATNPNLAGPTGSLPG